MSDTTERKYRFIECRNAINVPDFVNIDMIESIMPCDASHNWNKPDQDNSWYAVYTPSALATDDGAHPVFITLEQVKELLFELRCLYKDPERRKGA